MKKYLSVLVLVGLMVLMPSLAWGQVSTTVSKVVNPVIKKYTPLATDSIKANQPTSAIKKKSSYDPAVALIQARMTNLGVDPGTVDGINGTKTVNALKEVQRFFGMTADGVYGKETQKLFAVLPLNSSIRTTDPLVAIALKKYVKDQLRPVTPASNIAQINNQAKLASIPFTPKGITQVLSSSLAIPGFKQVSEATVAGARVSLKPKLLANGTKVALYTVSSGNNLGASTGSAASLNTNFSTATSGKANSVYVCGVVQKTSICTPVSFEIADAINKGTISLEQYLASKSNGGLCTTCFLDDEGNLGVITGDTGGNVNIPPTSGPAPVAEVTNMCMAYPFANTNTVSYEITFDKPVKVISPAGLSLDVVRYYNAPGKKINAKYVSSSNGDRTLRFSAPLSAGKSIYFEGEATLKFSPASKIVLASNNDLVSVDLLPDTFRLSSPCGTSLTYDVRDTNITLSPAKLYGVESFASPRHNVTIQFDEPITASSSLKLIMNPSDSGGTATGTLVTDKDTPNDTLVFHFNLPQGAKWDGILGTFAFDPNSGTVKNKSGKDQLLNIPAGQDSTGGTCALKYIGQVCVDWDNSGTVKYTVVYTRDITVKTNGSNSNIKLLIDPLNANASTITATLTGYDNKALFFSAPAQSSLLSDHVGYATLDIKNGASVFTINATLQSLGHTDQGGPADPDLGIFTATCDGSTGGDFTVTDNCMYFRQFPSGAPTGGTGSYRLVFSEPVTVVGLPEIKIQKTTGAPIVTAVFDGYDNADHTALKFTAQIGAGPNIGIDSPYFEGVATFNMPSGASIKNAAGVNAPTAAGTFSFLDQCPYVPPPVLVGDICLNLVGGYATYKVTFPDTILVEDNDNKNNIKLLINTAGTAPDFIAPYAYAGADGKSLFFVAQSNGSLLSNHIGMPTISLSGGATIKDEIGQPVNLNIAELTSSKLCPGEGWGGQYEGLIYVTSVEKGPQENVEGQYRLRIVVNFENSQSGNPNAYISGAPSLQLVNSLVINDPNFASGGVLPLVSGVGTQQLTFELTRSTPFDLTTFNKLLITGGMIHTLGQDAAGNDVYAPANLTGLNN